MNGYSPVRGYAPWENDMVLAAAAAKAAGNRNAYAECAAMLCRTRRGVQDQAQRLTLRAKRAERWNRLQARGFAKVTWLTREVRV